MSGVTFGATELPDRQAATLRKAVRYEWITIAFLADAITLVGLVAGNSQAMKVAWAEDMLSLARRSRSSSPYGSSASHRPPSGRTATTARWGWAIWSPPSP